jgi:hypothetical protein
MGRDNQILTDHYKTTGVATARRVRGRRESLSLFFLFSKVRFVKQKGLLNPVGLRGYTVLPTVYF